MKTPLPPLLVITDRHQARLPLPDAAARCLAGGARWLSLREKDLTMEARLALLARLSALGRPYDALIGYHGGRDEEELARARNLGVGAVHLPAGTDPARLRRTMGTALVIGLSAHREADLALAHGADYVSVSPIFPSASKPGYGPPLGLEGLSRFCRTAAMPVVALGGIHERNAALCLEAGAAAVAVMGAVMAAPDPAAVTSRLIAGLAVSRGDAS
ncbi:MAG TPA: thiamine phosphate synthase [Stellaceae bacterium]|nr:thiamine phosphate synthase [Stellaceae bacterium]